jgi:hypothetical protein
MRYIVLYAATCPACYKAARLVTNASVTGLEARSFEDPQVTGPLANAGLAVPDRPSLMVIGDAGIQVLSGWAMRRRLASVVGWRRSGTIIRLLAGEWRARLTKPASAYAPSRRGVVAGILAGAASVAGWALASGTANASPAAAGTAAATPADPADAARVLKTATAQQAIRTWGPAEQHLLQSGGTDPVLILHHPARDIYTFIDNSPGALSGNQPAGISVGMAPSAEHAMRYYTLDGAPLADLTVSNGQATVTPVQAGTLAHGSMPVELTGLKEAAACFAVCLTGRVRPEDTCFVKCQECATYIPGTLAHTAACTACVICAGKYGLPCYRACKYLL